jgi:hypothetical protein
MRLLIHKLRVATIALVTLMPLPYAQAQGTARIYVYVQREMPVRSWLPISCDRAVVAKVKRGRFLAINVAPGRHMLRAEKSVPVFVDVRSGEEAFVRQAFVPPGWRNGQRGGPAIPFPVWQVVPPSVAGRDMIYLTYIDADEVLSQSVPKTDPRKLPEMQLKRRKATTE